MSIYVLSDNMADQAAIEEHLVSERFLNFQLVSSREILRMRTLIANDQEVCLVLFRVSDIDAIMYWLDLQNNIKALFFIECEMPITADPEICNETELVDISLYLNQFLMTVKQQLFGTEKPFLVRVGNKLKVIDKYLINYIESEGKYVNIYTDSSTFATRQTLKSILQCLPQIFCRVHSSYIVNVTKIKHFNTQDGQLFITGKYLPFSRKFKDSLFEHFTSQ